MAKIQMSLLWRTPDINPITGKARSIPCLNPFDMYGRVFFFSWFGFMVAFWAWFTFPPLLEATIKHDLHLTAEQIANSNIVSICATLCIRGISGPLCDAFGPRRVFGFLLLVGSLPIGLAPLVQDARGLYISRFFIGILGGTFVPCQVWATGFFDKNVVGTANALTGGWGNAGGGITYFIMPAVFDSFVSMGHSTGVAWRLTFLVPLAMVIVTGVALLLLCPDSPVGKWSERQERIQENMCNYNSAEARSAGVFVDIPGAVLDRPAPVVTSSSSVKSGTIHNLEKHDKDMEKQTPVTTRPPSPLLTPAPIDSPKASKDPALHDTMHVIFSPQTLFHVSTYACSFGAELAVNAILGAYLLQKFPSLGQTGSGNWAAMFGFLNLATRPLGGFVADLLYSYFGSRGPRSSDSDSDSSSIGHSDSGDGGDRGLWPKKCWITTCGIFSGAALIALGKADMTPTLSLPETLGLVAIAALFIEAGNGANFALIPHVHPHANGVVSGLTGAGGNIGGVIFAVVFRFVGGGNDYSKGLWIIGCVTVVANVAVCWIRPVPQMREGETDH